MPTPPLSLPLMTLPCPRPVPPTRLSCAPLVNSTPRPVLPRSFMPVTSVPMRFPCTRFPVAVERYMTTPPCPLPLMTFPAPRPPPIELFCRETSTPYHPLPSAAAPSAVVPILLYCTVLNVAPALTISTPSRVLPEITLRITRFHGAPSSCTPLVLLASLPLPAPLVPM